jgi:hypothetical protein
MIRTAISQAAFDAIAATMPLGSVAYEKEAKANGERKIWLAAHVVNRLRSLRGPGESYSDVILWLVADGEGGRALDCHDPHTREQGGLRGDDTPVLVDPATRKIVEVVS